MSIFGRIVLVGFIIVMAFLAAGLGLGAMTERFKKIAEHQDLHNNEKELEESINRIIDERLKFNDIPQLVREACKEYLVVSEDLEIDAIDIAEEDSENDD